MHFFDILMRRELAGADLTAVGSPNQGAPASAQDQGVAGDIGVVTGPASQKLKLTTKEIPKPEDVDGLVAYIKAFRSQLEIRSALNTLASTVVDGFRLKGSPEVQSWASKRRLHSKLQRVALDLATIGWCCVYVSEDPKLPPTITILHNVAIKRDVWGQEVIYLQLTDEAKAAVKLNPKAYPAYWSKYLDDPAGINITRVYGPDGKTLQQGGAYFVTIESDGEDIFPIPPVFPFLARAASAHKVSDSVNTFADAVKYYLLHAAVGDKSGSDFRDGRPKPPSPERLRETFNALSLGFKAGALVTPSDVDVSFKVLTEDPFAVPRAQNAQVQAELQKRLGSPDFEGAQSEGAAMFMARSFLPSLRYLRHACIADQLINPLLSDLAAANRLPGIGTARVLWSEDSVHDFGTKLNAAKFMQSTGGYSVTSLLEYLNPDYDMEREFELKRFEGTNADLIGNIYEISQGLADKALQQAAKAPEAAPAPKGKKPAPDQNADPGGAPPK